MLFRLLFMFCIACTFVSQGQPVSGQIAFSVTQQNGVVTGGGLQIGGVLNASRTGVGLSLTTGVNQQIGIAQFQPQVAAGRVALARARARARATALIARNRRPNPERFAQAALQFDADDDKRLSQQELQQVATAFVEEVRKRDSNQLRRLSVVLHAGRRSGGSHPTTSSTRLADAFVTRCMNFDADGDQALDNAETKRMATGLIRLLS